MPVVALNNWTLTKPWNTTLAVLLPLAVWSWLGTVAVAADPPAARESSASAKPAGAGKSAEEFFNEYALPIFKQHCYKCHSHAAGKAKGGLVLDSRSGWAKGGDSGPAVVPGKPEDSLLIKAVRHAGPEMPPTGKLPPEVIATLERWVAAGAVDPRTTAAVQAQAAVDLEAGRKHWAFQPLRAAPPPKVLASAWPKDDADRFLLAKLEERGLHPVADADRYTWLRRVSLDLTGLPPTPAQIAAFIDDSSPQAHERVVDRLLAARGFGERWGRHWLDLVGYADQIGTANDIFAEHAWRYRDYVIAAFNADMPFDRFIREQLAGDLLPHKTTEQRTAQLVATGFLLLGDLPIVEADKAKLRVEVVDRQVDKIGRAFLGMTVGCARCHDHKFDPIPQRDYYALAGILNSTESVHKTENWGVWSWPTVLDLPETEAQETERQARLESHRQRLEALKADRDRLHARKAEVDAVLKDKAAPPAGKAADATKLKDKAAPPADKTADATKSDGPADAAGARVVLKKLQQDLAGRLQKIDREIQHAEFFTPAPPKAFAVRDVAEPADMHITVRGNAHALGDKVARGFLQAASVKDAPSLPARASGRRELADWIAAPDNPLTARVAVNRIWQKLFGEGIVRSVDYFGLPGDRPVHPELLDHLAKHFVADGWSQKRLIRALVLGRAYRLSSQNEARAMTVDPDNRLFWRMNRRRLDAEAIRDSLLAVSGKLLETGGGPSLPLEYPENAGNLDKKDVNPPSFQPRKFRPEQAFERTVYLPILRSAPQAGPGELRNVFDFTQPAEFAGQRAVTTVPTQALFLLNSKLMKDRARDLAERLLHNARDDAARLELLWLRVYNRPIEPAERTAALKFLADLRNQPGAKPAESESRSWAELCHSLLASNEFLMRL